MCGGGGGGGGGGGLLSMDHVSKVTCLDRAFRENGGIYNTIFFTPTHSYPIPTVAMFFVTFCINKSMSISHFMQSPFCVCIVTYCRFIKTFYTERHTCKIVGYISALKLCYILREMLQTVVLVATAYTPILIYTHMPVISVRVTYC